MLRVQDVDLTPNPQALKFILSEKLLKRETRHFKNKEEAQSDPLAKGIFEIEGVESVFYMDKFVTVEKNPSVDWGKIQMPFIKFVQGFDKSLLPKEEVPAALGKEEENELLMKINAFLDQRVRPALAGDGGGLQVLGIDGYMLRIRYQGACGSCPSAISGTLNAIENLLKREINPAIEVIPG
ncbi:MAG: NifU family protein [Ignavibacteria bacterium]|jgi:Fe-S cluster biogenesis protein NfuA|nr:NifU family protein [Ignavibacteria bacterium]MCU7504958.1 NifU family protein [Ignavibacteria bacterium]MCU7514908.1 NifU family protein [Ignavibacteria bacterium]